MWLLLTNIPQYQKELFYFGPGGVINAERKTFEVGKDIAGDYTQLYAKESRQIGKVTERPDEIFTKLVS